MSVDKVPSSPEACLDFWRSRDWTVGGAEIGQGTMQETNQFLKPVRLYKDPFLGNNVKSLIPP